jgi:GMP synthase-like glutamine amidotransferase
MTSAAGEKAVSQAGIRPILVIENDLSDPVGRLGEWLRKDGATLDVRSGAAEDEIPESLEGFAGLIVMGGWQNAYQDDKSPWLPRVRALLAEAVADGVPALGICLGGQLLAAATGGQIERAETPEYGAQLVAKRQAAADDALFASLPITPDVLQWHVDEITRLPAGAVLLASSPTCEVQAFRVGNRAWGLQFHIETEPATVARWASEDSDALAQYDVEGILSRSAAAHDDIAETWRPFAATFVRVVADPSLAAAPRSLPMAGPPATTAGPITDPAAIRAALAAELQAARGPHAH